MDFSYTVYDRFRVLVHADRKVYRYAVKKESDKEKPLNRLHCVLNIYKTRKRVAKVLRKGIE